MIFEIIKEATLTIRIILAGESDDTRECFLIELFA